MNPLDCEETKMYFYENRLKSFSGWPFEDGCACTSENMARAGFIHTPSENSPDTAQCFFCYKELEGWEPDDDPVKEHRAHSPACDFIALKKDIKDLTVEEMIKLEKERTKFLIKKRCSLVIERFEDAAKSRRADLMKAAIEVE